LCLQDFSNFPKDHDLYSDKKALIPGYFKSELSTDHIEEYVGLNAKVYSLKVEDEAKNKKVHKGKYLLMIQQLLRLIIYF